MPFYSQDMIDVPLFSFFDEAITQLDWVTKSIEREQLMFTEETLLDSSRTLFPKEMAALNPEKQSREEITKRLDKIHAKVADHYAVFNAEFAAADLISPKGMEDIMFLYSEVFFDDLDSGERAVILEKGYVDNLIHYVEDVKYCWECFFAALERRLPKRSGVFRAEYVCHLLNDIFVKRINDFDGKVSRELYRQRVEAFNCELANLADRMSGVDEKWQDRMNAFIEADDDYYAAGRHVLVDVYDDPEWPLIGPVRYFQKPGRLYYVRDMKYKYGYGHVLNAKRKERKPKDNEDARTRPTNVVISGISKDAVQTLKRGVLNTGRPKAKSIRFTQGMVAALCGVGEGTVANWDTGRTKKIPPGYSRELREKGGSEFYNFITEYWRTRNLKEGLKAFLEGKVAYLEGLTEREAGMVQDFINSCRNGGVKP